MIWLWRRVRFIFSLSYSTIVSFFGANQFRAVSLRGRWFGIALRVSVEVPSQGHRDDSRGFLATGGARIGIFVS